MNVSKIFFNEVGRLRSGWRLLIFAGVLIALLFLMGTVIRGVLALLFNFAPAFVPKSFVSEIVFRFLYLGSALLAGYLCGHWLEGLPWRALGASLHKRWFRHFFSGSIVGLLTLVLATALATAAGGISFSFAGKGALLLVTRTLVGSAALFIVAAFAEEALFRGYPLQTLSRARLAWLGILLTSLPFAAAHLGNPNSSLLGSINTGLAGVWLAVAYLHSRSLWFPLGVHWSWNWALGSLFGLPVSGIDSFAPDPLLRGADLGPAWLTGGAYGIEGGIACTAALIVSTILIWRTRIVVPDEELLKLTSQENPVQRDQLSILPEEAT